MSFKCRQFYEERFYNSLLYVDNVYTQVAYLYMCAHVHCVVECPKSRMDIACRAILPGDEE